MKTKIDAEVRKQTAHLKPSHFETEVKNQASTPFYEQVLEQKADKQELEVLQMNKANKSDAEMAIRCIGILHKQIVELSVLLLERSKLSLDEENGETRNSLKTKKTGLHKQAVLVNKLILSFDAARVNDCFEERPKKSSTKFNQVSTQRLF